MLDLPLSGGADVANQEEGLVLRTRARLRSNIPPRYRWQKHVTLIVAFELAGFAAILFGLGGMQPGDGWRLLAILVFLNFSEYAAHRWTLHRPAFPRAVYHRHVIEHHAFFSYRSMAVESWSDLRWVLFPWWALPLLVVSVLPFFLLLRVAGSPHLAWLFVLAVMTYYGIYEILHTLAHLPDEQGWARRPWVQVLTHHHRVHHDPSLMRRYNFSFVIPFFDLLFGTKHR